MKVEDKYLKVVWLARNLSWPEEGGCGAVVGREALVLSSPLSGEDCSANPRGTSVASALAPGSEWAVVATRRRSMDISSSGRCGISSLRVEAFESGG